ncbi:hypothetical protein [Methylobacterium trifolii]|uniref:Uncharacterized protein n=1 Tax=Methylobacterium trifolii TaxID=1003092 RepID=A0ABQ4U6M3_9HYPH|nr:hypothetical protein [Methylobacterium trifolii]GJE62517.1 hypothetical protein MPOCJGCO_4650 [Methylobacterium trifolii]
MASVAERELEHSPLSGRITLDGVTVEVHICRFAGTDDEWTLEVVDHEGGHTVWDTTFADDQDAYEAFELAVAENGIRSFADEPALH